MRRLTALAYFTSFSLIVGCSSDGGGPAAPTLDAPSDLTVISATAGSVLLSWTDNGVSPNELGFRIERASTVATEFANIGDVESDITSYPDTSAAEGMSYQYRVKSFAGSSVSNASNVVVVPVSPKSPEGLTATQNPPDSMQIDLTWTDRSAVETGFQIERKVGSGEYERIAEPAANVTSYSNIGLVKSTTFTYRVRAVKGSDTSAFSNEATARTTVRTPAAPFGLSAEVRSSAEIRLVWSLRSSDELGTIIERSTSSASGFASIDTTGPGTTGFTDVTVRSQTSYYYRVFAYNSFGRSDASNITLEAITPAGPPAAPSNLAGDTLSWQELLITWNDNSDDELAFQLQRHDSHAQSFSDLAIVAGSANATAFYTDENVLPNSVYYFRVRSYKIVGPDTLRSSWATTLNIRTPKGPPDMPTNFKAVVDNMHQVTVTWQPSNNSDFTLVERKEGSNGRWQQAAAPEFPGASFTNINLSINTYYYYRAVGVNGKGESDYTPVDSCITLLLLTPQVDGADFEAYEAGAAPPSPPWSFEISDAEVCWTEVNAVNPHGGSNCLMIHDESATAYSRNYLTVQPTQAAVMSAWLFIPSGQTIGFLAYDGNGGVIYRVEYSSNNSLLYYWGNPGTGQNFITTIPNAFTFDQWFRMIAQFNVTTAKYTLSVNGKIIVSDIGTLVGAHPNNNKVEFLAFSNATSVDVKVDDVGIFRYGAAGMPPQSPTPPPANAVTIPFSGDPKKVAEAAAAR